MPSDAEQRLAITSQVAGIVTSAVVVGGGGIAFYHWNRLRQMINRVANGTASDDEIIVIGHAVGSNPAYLSTANGIAEQLRRGGRHTEADRVHSAVSRHGSTASLQALDDGSQGNSQRTNVRDQSRRSRRSGDGSRPVTAQAPDIEAGVLAEVARSEASTVSAMPAYHFGSSEWTQYASLGTSVNSSPRRESRTSLNQDSAPAQGQQGTSSRPSSARQTPSNRVQGQQRTSSRQSSVRQTPSNRAQQQTGIRQIPSVQLQQQTGARQSPPNRNQQQPELRQSPPNRNQQQPELRQSPSNQAQQQPEPRESTSGPNVDEPRNCLIS